MSAHASLHSSLQTLTLPNGQIASTDAELLVMSISGDDFTLMARGETASLDESLRIDANAQAGVYLQEM